MKKQELRQLNLKKRESIPDCDIEDKSQQIAMNFFKYFDLTKISSIHCFLPSGSRKEVNTWLLIERVRIINPAVNIVVPVCDFVTGELNSSLLSDKTVLKENKWGIQEPEVSEPFSDLHIDLVITPLVGFDMKGNRVGYGKGFYDKFFRKCRQDVTKVGLSLFDPSDLIEDISGNDIPLDSVVTADNCYFFK